MHLVSYVILIISLFCLKRFFNLCIYYINPPFIAFNSLARYMVDLPGEWSTSSTPPHFFFIFSFINVIILFFILIYHQNLNVKIITKNL